MIGRSFAYTLQLQGKSPITVTTNASKGNDNFPKWSELTGRKGRGLFLEKFSILSTYEKSWQVPKTLKKICHQTYEHSSRTSFTNSDHGYSGLRKKKKKIPRMSKRMLINFFIGLSSSTCARMSFSRPYLKLTEFREAGNDNLPKSTRGEWLLLPKRLPFKSWGCSEYVYRVGSSIVFSFPSEGTLLFFPLNHHPHT